MEQVQRQQAEAFKRAQQATGTSQGTMGGQANTAANGAKKETPVEAEYIDFEEVKK